MRAHPPSAAQPAPPHFDHSRQYSRPRPSFTTSHNDSVNAHFHSRLQPNPGIVDGETVTANYDSTPENQLLMRSAYPPSTGIVYPQEEYSQPYYQAIPATAALPGYLILSSHLNTCLSYF